MKTRQTIQLARGWVFTLALVASFSLASAGERAAPAPESPEFPVYVMKKIDDLYRGTSSHGTMVMTVQTKHWKRSMTMESWSLGEKYSLMRILEPKKEKGTATLKADQDLYTYLSKTDRSIKITSNMMGGSWMGSHFTNDDLVRHTRFDTDFHIKLSFNGKENGVLVYRFELKPKPNVPVVWGRVDVTVRQSDLQPVSETSFDEKGKKVRVLEFSNHQKLGDRIMPFKMVMRPTDGSGEYTQIEWKDVTFDVKLDKSFFSIQNLKRF